MKALRESELKQLLKVKTNKEQAAQIKKRRM